MSLLLYGRENWVLTERYLQEYMFSWLDGQESNDEVAIAPLMYCSYLYTGNCDKEIKSFHP